MQFLKERITLKLQTYYRLSMSFYYGPASCYALHYRIILHGMLCHILIKMKLYLRPNLSHLMKYLLLCLLMLTQLFAISQTNHQKPRERFLMDLNWRFSFGHPYDTKKDFDNGTGYFSYFAKAGYGDGAADPKF